MFLKYSYQLCFAFISLSFSFSFPVLSLIRQELVMASFTLWAFEQSRSKSTVFMQFMNYYAHLFEYYFYPSLTPISQRRTPSARAQSNGYFYTFYEQLDVYSSSLHLFLLKIKYKSDLQNLEVILKAHLLQQQVNNKMGKFNKGNKNDPSSQSRKLFFDTITDMRNLIKSHTKDYTADTLGLGNKTKMPYTHLVGRRKVIKDRYKAEKQRAREQSIQYDSSMQLLNSHLMEKKKEKDQFQKNKYKFSGMEGGRIGRQKDGFLQIGKKDLDRIYGDQLNEKGKNGKNGHKHGGKFGNNGKRRKNIGKGGKGKFKKFKK